MTLPEVTPTDEQREIIEASAASRTVVLAPAGTGKTEVVADRLEYLVEKENLVPGSELLVLSFSRNAVREVKRRLRSVGPSVAAAQIATFDSYATRLLATWAEVGDWEADGYDGRIRRALELVKVNEDALRDLGRYRHVVVDEVQDLVGDRAELVDAILVALAPDAGFTLLGDPAQGIYDFQLKGSRSRATGRQFLRRVLDRAPEPKVRTLTRDFRTRTKVGERAARCGSLIRTRAIDPNGTGTDDGGIGAALFGLPSLKLERATKVLARAGRDGATAAVLCRTNGQALVVSRALDEADVLHVLQPGAADRPIAAWLAGVFRGYSYPTISRAVLEERLLRLEQHPDLDFVWRGLKRAEGRRSPDISVRLVASRVRAGAVPEELVAALTSQVVVSSVHRAKGLEWDIVFLAGMEESGDDEFDDARLRYVAMTRAREELYILPCVDDRGLRTRDRPDRRWVRTERAGSRAVQIELLADDVERIAPGGARFLDIDAARVQDYLTARVRPGDLVDLRLIRSFVDGEPRAFYRIDHEGTAIGVTSDHFSEVLAGNIGPGRPIEFPRRITHGRVQALETVVGSSAAGARAGLGGGGLWLRPRLAGLADLVWGDGK